jgi:multidrug efflux pump subunit AcrA (membrane-fusion protein)
MKKKLLAFAGSAALVGAGAMLVGAKKHQLEQLQPPSVAPMVIAARVVEAGPVKLTLHATAEVDSLHDTMVASRLSGYVMASTRFEGDHFKRGDVLVRLDASQAEADLQRAEAVLAQSRLQEAVLTSELAAAESGDKAEQQRLERFRSLYAIEGVSKEQVESAEANATSMRARRVSAKAALQSYSALLKANESSVVAAKDNLRYAQIAAPFDGVVSQRLAQPGDLVTPGKALLKITDLSAGTRLLVNVPQGVAAVGLEVGGLRLPLTAWPEAGPQGLRRFEARASNGQFTPGTRVEGKLAIFESARAVLLPAHCLLNDDGHTATVVVIKMPEGGSRNAIEVRHVTLAAVGEEGAVTSDVALGGASVACGGPDALSRLLGGVPFVVGSAE